MNAGLQTGVHDPEVEAREDDVHHDIEAFERLGQRVDLRCIDPVGFGAALGKTRRERLRGLKAPVRDDEPLDLRALRDEGGDDGADRAGPEDDNLDDVKTPRTRGDGADT